MKRPTGSLVVIGNTSSKVSCQLDGPSGDHGVVKHSPPQQSAPPGRVFNLDDDDGVTFALFREFALRDRAYHGRALNWPTEVRMLPDLGEALASGQNVFAQSRVIRRGSTFCHVRVTEGVAWVSLAASDEADLDAAERELRELIPRPPVRTDDDRSSIIRFWYHTPRGATAIARRISVPDWRELRANYASTTIDQLAPLMDGWRPTESGRLLRWHGPPGTGKTYALRALTWQWREWCEAHYIIDPERLFSERPDYMLEVLLNTDDGLDELDFDEPEQPDGSEARSRPWRLLILEDTGELLAADAKEREGQGLSRLLNLVDGLIGQGLRVVVLVTGNEPLRRLHPAISRPGRCAAIVEFRAFSSSEACEWLEDRGADQVLSAGGTLAELYASLDGHRRKPEPALGFAAGLS
jgi:hypothetical protein